jgi:hypothetical protein
MNDRWELVAEPWELVDEWELATFDESKHPRGDQKNAGHFAKGAGGASKGKKGKTAAAIKTMADVDEWRKAPANHRTTAKGPYAGEKFIMSRYDALKELFGENSADKMMRELEVNSWFDPKAETRQAKADLEGSVPEELRQATKGAPHFAPPPEGEQIVNPPAAAIYAPNPLKLDPKTGVSAAARVGVPGMESPPPPKTIGRLPNLTEKERAAESRFADAFLADPDGVVAKYRAAQNHVVGEKNGKPVYEIGDAPHIYGTDDVKALSLDYNPPGASEEESKAAKGIYNVALHQTANAIAKRAFLQKLTELAQGPEEKRTVLVTSGGVASGKGYALKNIPETAGMLDAAGAVWDAAGEQNATENPWVLDECRKRGIKTIFAFIHADPVSTWENPEGGVVERAGKIGRMVSANLFADSYAIGARNFQAFMSQHGKDADARFFVLKNARGSKPTRQDAIPEEALTLDSATLRATASGVLESRADTLKPSVLRGGLIGDRIWGRDAGEWQLATFNEDEHPRAKDGEFAKKDKSVSTGVDNAARTVDNASGGRKKPGARKMPRRKARLVPDESGSVWTFVGADGTILGKGTYEEARKMAAGFGHDFPEDQAKYLLSQMTPAMHKMLFEAFKHVPLTGEFKLSREAEALKAKRAKGLA